MRGALRRRVGDGLDAAGLAGMHAGGGGFGPRQDRVRRARRAESAVVSSAIPRLEPWGAVKRVAQVTSGVGTSPLSWCGRGWGRWRRHGRSLQRQGNLDGCSLARCGRNGELSTYQPCPLLHAEEAHSLSCARPMPQDRVWYEALSIVMDVHYEHVPRDGDVDLDGARSSVSSDVRQGLLHHPIDGDCARWRELNGVLGKTESHREMRAVGER